MSLEPAQPEIIHPQKIKAGLSFRLLGWQAEEYLSGFSLANQVKKFLVDWQAFRKGLNDWNFWKPPAVFIFIDDGLGMKGACKAHGYPHIQIYPVNASPTLCHDAVLLRDGKK